MAVWEKYKQLELFICGVTAPAPARPGGGEPPYPRNEAFVARFNPKQRVDEYRQAKHHRWRLDSSQIENYRLSHVLNAGRSWWEQIGLADRRMVFGLDSRQAVIAALICDARSQVAAGFWGTNRVQACWVSGRGHGWPIKPLFLVRSAGLVGTYQRLSEATARVRLGRS